LSVNVLQVEAVLAGSSYVDNVMLHADPFHSYTVALVVAKQAALEAWAKKAGVDYSDFADLCSKPQTSKEVLGSLSQVRKAFDELKFDFPDIMSSAIQLDECYCVRCCIRVRINATGLYNFPFELS